jgi:hypothetical protein
MPPFAESLDDVVLTDRRRTIQRFQEIPGSPFGRKEPIDYLAQLGITAAFALEHLFASPGIKIKRFTEDLDRTAFTHVALHV